MAFFQFVKPNVINTSSLFKATPGRCRRSARYMAMKALRTLSLASWKLSEAVIFLVPWWVAFAYQRYEREKMAYRIVWFFRNYICQHRSLAAALEDGEAKIRSASASICSGCSVWSMFSIGSRESIMDMFLQLCRILSLEPHLVVDDPSSHYQVRSHTIFLQHYLLLDVQLTCLSNLFSPALTVLRYDFRDIAACAVGTCMQLSQKRQGFGRGFRK